MESEFLATFLSLALTVLIGLTASIAASRQRTAEELPKNKVEDLLEASQARAEEANAKLLEELVKKVPDRASAEHFATKLSGQIRAGGDDLVVNQIAGGKSGFIEDLVNGYHQQALNQARVQFWFSVCAATVGFCYILYNTSGDHDSYQELMASAFPGAVIDVVAALFFTQAEKTRKRATELYDRLRSDNRLQIAQSTVEQIEDVRIRSATRATIALHLSGLKPVDVDLNSLSRESKT